MDRVKQIWLAQEKAYNEMMEEDDQYCHQESFRWGFEQGVDWAEKDLIPLINRLCEAILFDWEDKDQAELAWKIQSQIKEETK